MNPTITPRSLVRLQFISRTGALIPVMALLLGPLMGRACGSTNEAGLAVVSASNPAALTTTSNAYVDVEGMQAGILTQEAADLQVTFSAEASISGSAGGRMWVRALVDGEPARPSEVVFTQETKIGARAFSFVVQNVRSGGHWVEIQWLVDAGNTGRLGAMTLTVKSAPRSTVSGGLVTAVESAAASRGVGYASMPGMAVQVNLQARSNVTITLSTELITTLSNGLFVRPVIDGVPEPGDVRISAGGFDGVQTCTFVKENLAPGVHDIIIQWGASSGSAVATDRTLCVFHCPQGTLERSLGVAAQASEMTTTSTPWVDFPDLTETVALGEPANLEVVLSGTADASSGDLMFLRALVDGQAADPPQVIYASGNVLGSRSFTFSREGLAPGSHTVTLQWSVSAGGTATMGDAHLATTLVAQQVPDMTRPYAMGGSSFLRPAVGKRRILTLLWDPDRPDHPAPDKADLEDLLFGPGYSVLNYYQENSGGRLTLENEGVLGWFDADYHPGSTYWGLADKEDLPEDRNGNGVIDPGEDLNHNGKLDDPDGIFQPDEDTNGNGMLDSDLNHDGWITWHQRSWWEAVREANRTVNFLQYDDDHDGVLSFDELIVLIVIPQSYEGGVVREAASSQYPTVKPLVVDGVVIPQVAVVYPGSGAANLGLFAHELSHILIGSGDMYVDSSFFKPTKPGQYSVMDANSNHHDAFHKIRSGWLNPTVVRTDGAYPLAAAGSSDGGCLLYDPCRGNDEYFLVENRSGFEASTAYVDHPARFAAVPPALEGATWIRTANSDKFNTRSDLISFGTSADIDVYIAHDDRYLFKPAWLGAFADTGLNVAVGTVRFSLFHQSFPARSNVTLGGNVVAGDTTNASMYSVIITGVSVFNPISGLVSRGNGASYELVAGLTGPLHFDNALPTEGLAVWHVIEEPAVHNALPAPPGVDPILWASNEENAGPGRRAVQMIRPIQGSALTQYHWELWAGGDSGTYTGYDILSTAEGGDRSVLAWADGSPAGYSVREIPAPAPTMPVTIGVETGIFPAIAQLGAISGRFYRYLESGLRPGALAYLDRDAIVYTSVPPELSCAAFIQTANDDKFSTATEFLHFEAAEAVTVWIAYDDRYAARPGWMVGFIDSTLDLAIGGQSYSLYVKTFGAGTVTLGGNIQPGETANFSMYTVALTDPLVDQRTAYGECYVTWAQQHWHISKILAGATTRPGDDPDDDSKDNLFEFAFGERPDQWSSCNGVTIEYLPGGLPSNFRLALAVNRAAVPCVRYVAERSTNLTLWQPLGEINQPSLPAGQSVVLPIPDLPPGGREFYRVEVIKK